MLTYSIMTAQTVHKIIVRSEDAIQGSPSNFLVPISISNLENLPKVTQVKLEWTSIITSPNYVNFYIASDSIATPQTYNSTNKLENRVLGVVPFQTNDSTLYYHYASPQSNQPVPLTNASGIIKSGMLNIRVVGRDGVDIPSFAQNFSLSLIFS